MTHRVKMGLTDMDMANAQHIEELLKLPHKAEAVSVALAFTCKMLEETQDENVVMLLRNEKSGITQKVMFPSKE